MAKILVVDDDPDIVEATQLFLAREGHQVEVAYNRQDGLKKVASFKPDLLILDVMMEQPDDGFAMAQDLRRAGNKCPSSCSPPWHRVSGLVLRARTTRWSRWTTSRPSPSSPRTWSEGDRPLEAIGGTTMLDDRTRAPRRTRSRPWPTSYGHDRTALIPILQEVKRKYQQHRQLRHAGGRRPAGHPPGGSLQRGVLLRLPGRASRRASSSSGCAGPSPATCRTRTGSRASWRTTWASASARPPPTASSPSSGPTAWACATRARPCWSTTRLFTRVTPEKVHEHPRGVPPEPSASTPPKRKEVHARMSTKHGPTSSAAWRPRRA